MATAIHYLGQILNEHLEMHVKNAPEQAKKKISLYLKVCQRFLCDSELALLYTRTCPSGFDERTVTAIKDVISSHRQHSDNLKNARRIIGAEGRPELLSVVKKVDSTTRRMESMLNTWMGCDFGGRSFGR